MRGVDDLNFHGPEPQCPCATRRKSRDPEQGHKLDQAFACHDLPGLVFFRLTNSSTLMTVISTLK